MSLGLNYSKILANSLNILKHYILITKVFKRDKTLDYKGSVIKNVKHFFPKFHFNKRKGIEARHATNHSKRCIKNAY